MTTHTDTPVQVGRHERGTRALVEAVRSGQLAPAGAPGGPPWTAAQQALLFDSLETGWPIGQLIIWTPPGEGSTPPQEVLLDGHRRVSALTQLLPDPDPSPAPGRSVLRDLSTETPRYLPADRAVPGGRYLPMNAMLNTMDFLAATRSMGLAESDPRYEVALKASGRIHKAVVEIVHIRQSDPTRVAELCQRLIPGRVDPTLPTQLTADR